MRDLYFTPETDINKIKAIQDSYEYEDDIMLNSITIEDDLSVRVADDNYGGTNDFYKNFYGLLNIPYPFTGKIPIDLLQTNVDRLKNEFNTPIKLVKRDDTLINIIKDTNRNGDKLFFQTLNTDMLLDNFSSDNFSLKNCFIGDDGAVVDIVHKDLGVFEMDSKEGDIVEIGYRLKNPFTLHSNKLSMSIYLNQLVCSNGMTMSKEFGSVSLNLNKNIGDEQTFLDRFRTNIDSQINRNYSLDDIAKIYTEMNKTLIKYRWLKPIINTVKNIDSVLLSSVFKLDWEEDAEYMKDCFDNRENEDSDYKYFDTIFSITEKAQKLPIRDRLFLEDFNQKIIKLFTKQQAVIFSQN